MPRVGETRRVEAPRRFTLRDLLDKRCLRKWLGITEEELGRKYPYEIPSYGPRRGKEDNRTVEELFAEWWADYLREKNEVKQPTVKQLVSQWIREEFGLGKGTVDERRAKLKKLYPDKFS